MTTPRGRFGWLCALAFAATATAEAKVVFTGYADFRFTGYGRTEIGGTPSVLSTFGLTKSTLESRGSAFDTVGLFATSNLAEDTDFLLDVTYRDIGFTAKTLRLQYAYVAHKVSDDVSVRLGKITLPFGIFNESRFYPFQRPSITPPSFHSGILGLPISDLGGAASLRAALGPVGGRLDAYAVNGYGSVPTSTTSFRNASIAGGLGIANNLAARNSNDRMALGGRLALFPAQRPEAESGVSYYRGTWDAKGHHLFQMLGAHAKAQFGPFGLLAEYLHLRTEGDLGMVATFGASTWRTNGYFATADWAGEWGGLKLTPWVRYEDYRSRGVGGTGHESLKSGAAGLAWQANGGLQLKLEFSRLQYVLPSTTGDLKLDADSILAGVVVTY